jgi:hypothetical protein
MILSCRWLRVALLACLLLTFSSCTNNDAAAAPSPSPQSSSTEKQSAKKPSHHDKDSSPTTINITYNSSDGTCSQINPDVGTPANYIKVTAGYSVKWVSTDNTKIIDIQFSPSSPFYDFYNGTYTVTSGPTSANIPKGIYSYYKLTIGDNICTNTGTLGIIMM